MFEENTALYLLVVLADAANFHEQSSRIRTDLIKPLNRV